MCRIHGSASADIPRTIDTWMNPNVNDDYKLITMMHFGT
jgi:hypothetical protein